MRDRARDRRGGGTERNAMGADGDRRRSHCGGGRRSIVRTKQRLLVLFSKVALGMARMAWALLPAKLAEEFLWCVPILSASLKNVAARTQHAACRFVPSMRRWLGV